MHAKRSGKGDKETQQEHRDSPAERKKARSAAEEKQAPVEDVGYFRLLVENAYDAIVLMNADGTLRYISPSIEPILGYTPEELLDTDPFDFVHPDDVDEVARLFWEGVEEPGRTEHVEYRLRHKDGSWHIVEAVGKNLLHEPSVAGIVINMRDITNYRRIEEELRESEERYRHLVENLSDVVFTVDRHGVITYISPAVERAGIHSVAEMIGQPLMRFVHPDDAAALLGSFERVISGASEPHEFRIMDKDGALRYMKTSSRPIMVEGEAAGLIGIMTEITDQVLAMQARRRSEEHFRELIRRQIRYYRGT